MMRIDAYTKVVLTVIAVCLFYSTAKDVISAAHAQTATPVSIVSVGSIIAPGYVPVKIMP